MGAVIFDLDGTLIDSAPDLQHIANGILAQKDKAPLSIEETRSFVGEGAAVFVTRMCASRDLPASEHTVCLAAFLKAYPDAVDRTRVFPGVSAALARLQERNLRLGICTNKPMAPTLSVLRHLKLDTYFEAVVAGDTLPTRKPDSAPLALAVQRLDRPTALYVGDTEIDAETAVNASVPFVLFNRGYRKKPDVKLTNIGTFDHFDELDLLVQRHFEPPE